MDVVKEKVRLVSREEISFFLPYWFYKTLDEEVRKGLDAEYWRRMDFATDPKRPRVCYQRKWKKKDNVPADEVVGE